jgi:peptidoglycan/xylan/chitin deacetylase (PgdA/CDA1 family)
VSSNRKTDLSIFTFHRVLDKKCTVIPDWPDSQEFAAKIKWISRNADIVPLEQALHEVFRDGTAKSRLAAITFDDGYKDNLKVAVPVLKDLKAHATFFIATQYIEGHGIFDDRIVQSVFKSTFRILNAEQLGLGNLLIDNARNKQTSLHRLLEKLKYLGLNDRENITNQLITQLVDVEPINSMMDAIEIKKLVDSGMSLGSHSHAHAIATTLTDEAFELDLITGLDALEKISGFRAKLFAYPNGIPKTDFRESHQRILSRNGIEFALSTQSGLTTSESNRFAIPRITPWPQTYPSFWLQLQKHRLTRQFRLNSVIA